MSSPKASPNRSSVEQEPPETGGIESSVATSSHDDAVSMDTVDTSAVSHQTGSWKGWAELENDPV
jgi:hypothetical protein